MKQPLKSTPRTQIYILLSTMLLSLLMSGCAGAGSANTSQSPVRTTPLTLPPQHPLAGQPRDTGKLAKGAQLPGNEIKPLVFNLAYDTSSLDKDISQIYTPGSSSFHKYLTPAQITERYAVTDSQLQQVKDWLTQQNFTIVAVDPLRSSIQVQGSVSTIEKALNIQLISATLGNREVFTYQGEPKLPPQIASAVQSVVGLNNIAFPSFKPPFTIDQQGMIQSGADCAKYGAKQTLTRSKLAAAYQIDTLHRQNIQGQGMSVGVAEFSEPFDPNDVANYAACAGIPTPQIRTIDVDGHVDAGAGEGEAAMDVELIAGLAPKAQILVYQANIDNTTFAQGLVDVFNRVAADNSVQVLSVSYGTDENKFSLEEQAAVNNSLRRLAAEGISVFISSGDCGAYSMRVPHVAIVSFPASAPYAISVGGTYLQVNDSNTRTSETVWGVNDGIPLCQNEWGSGGGVSQNPDFHRPSWQVGPGTTNQYDGTTSAVVTATFPPAPISAPNGLRQVPDIAAAAYPNIAIFYQGAWIASGGTSAAAPIWAAGAVLVNQALQQKGKAYLGGVPEIYTIANHAGSHHPYNDITAGDNLFYPATAGWDYSTGWGAPNFNEILQFELG